MLTIGISLIFVGLVGQLHSRTPLPLKYMVWSLVIGLMFIWVVSH